MLQNNRMSLSLFSLNGGICLFVFLNKQIYNILFVTAMQTSYFVNFLSLNAMNCGDQVTFP